MYLNLLGLVCEGDQSVNTAFNLLALVYLLPSSVSPDQYVSRLECQWPPNWQNRSLYGFLFVLKKISLV